MLYGQVLGNYERACTQDVSSRYTHAKMDVWKASDDEIRDEKIRRYLGMTPVLDKIRETRLTWYCHIRRRLSTMLTRHLDMWVSA